MTSTDHAIDLEALLAPVPGAQPAGADLRYSPIYDKIKAARRAADDKQQGKSAFGDRDDKPSAEDRASAARQDWLEVENLTTDALATKSKDLQFAVWLLEAETYISGFSGAASTLELIRRLLEVYWNTVYPAVQEDDEPLALRVGVLEWINEKLPGILKEIPLSSGSRKYSLAHFELAQKATDEKSKTELAKEGRPSPEQFAQVMSASSAQDLEATAARIGECLSQLTQLEQATDMRFVAHGEARGVERPSFNNVRKALDDCQFQVARALRAKGPRDARPASPSGAEPNVQLLGGSGIWDRALQLALQGQLEGLRLAQEHIEAAPSGRERFLRQLQLSELCIQAGMHAFAYPILDELGKIIDGRDLVTWEDADVIRRTWSGLAIVCKPLARLHPESVARELVAQQRLTALGNDGSDSRS
jgi:type VI secretion system protein ImpA